MISAYDKQGLQEISVNVPPQQMHLEFVMIKRAAAAAAEKI